MPSSRETAASEGTALQRAAAWATLEAAARRELADAIAAAHAAGHSWRAIGSATGLPYQTLHRRSRSWARAT
jgi:hypothetical protein